MAAPFIAHSPQRPEPSSLPQCGDSPESRVTEPPRDSLGLMGAGTTVATPWSQRSLRSRVAPAEPQRVLARPVPGPASRPRGGDGRPEAQHLAQDPRGQDSDRTLPTWAHRPQGPWVTGPLGFLAWVPEARASWGGGPGSFLCSWDPRPRAPWGTAPHTPRGGRPSWLPAQRLQARAPTSSQGQPWVHLAAGGVGVHRAVGQPPAQRTS